MNRRVATAPLAGHAAGATALRWMIARGSRRCCTTTASLNQSHATTTVSLLSLLSTTSTVSNANLVHGAVIVSPFTCIYRNLAIEHALVSALRFRRPSRPAAAAGAATVADDDAAAAGPLLLLYCNDPCVVIGANQLAWREANVPRLDGAPWMLARRYSGGGAVAHDRGNLCLSFLSHRDAYSPSANATWLGDVLAAAGGDDRGRYASTNRHDLFIEGKKVSGSAMKLTRDTAYHHCTLLVTSNVDTIREYLHSTAAADDFFDSPCVASVRSPVTNLRTAATASLVATALAQPRIAGNAALMTAAGDALTDGVARLVADRFVADHPGARVLLLDPKEDDYSATASPYNDRTRGAAPVKATLAATETALRSWDWVFGTTLRFTQRIALQPPALCGHLASRLGVVVTVKVERGIIAEATVAMSVADSVADTASTATAGYDDARTATAPLTRVVLDAVAAAAVGCAARRQDLDAASRVFEAGLLMQLTEDDCVVAFGADGGAAVDAWWRGFVAAWCRAAGWGA